MLVDASQSESPSRAGRCRIDDAPTGDVDVDPGGRWRVESYFDVESDDESEDAVRLDGRIGEAAFVRTPMPAPDASSGRDAASAAWRRSGAGHCRDDASSRAAGTCFSLLVPDLTLRSVLARTGGTAPGILARSRLTLDCYGPSLTSPDATCLATTGDETFIWDVAADAGPPRPIASMIGRIVGRTYEEQALLLWRDHDLLLLWRGTNHACASRRGPDARARTTLVRRGHVATLTRLADRDVVVRYPVAPPR